MGFIPTIGPFGLLTTDTAYVLRASDTLRLDSDNVIRLGLEYRNNAGTGISQSGTIGYQVYAASAMWDWQITPALSFTNAVRADYLALNYSGQLLPGSPFTTSEYNNETLVAPSFNSGLVCKLTDLDTIRLTGGRGCRFPVS